MLEKKVENLTMDAEVEAKKVLGLRNHDQEDKSAYNNLSSSDENEKDLAPMATNSNPDFHNKIEVLHVFVVLCYPNNDSEDLGKLQAKANIGIFIRYAPKKKAYRIYNRRTRKIIETIHVDFDEMTAMASEQLGSRHGLQIITLATFSSGLVPNPIPQQPFLVAAAPRAVELADSPVSTSIDQDAPSTKSLHEESTSQGSNLRCISEKTQLSHEDQSHYRMKIPSIILGREDPTSTS
ncbi:retrovirus-related pol polyprotein from transposon TNT 1-94 [Tanacetum coccineum]